MRRLALVTLVVLAAAAPAQARSTCTPHGSKTIAANTQLRVFTFRKSGSDTTNLYACRLKNRKRFLLASAEEAGGTGTSVSLVRVAGRFVAWDSQPFDDSQRYNPDFQGFPSSVNALDTGSGQRRTAPATTGNPAASTVTGLVLKPSGAFAWIGSAATLEVHRYDAAGDTLVDSGADVDPASLAAGSAQLYWTRGGAPHSAPFS
jgi:hypothetical protein